MFVIYWGNTVKDGKPLFEQSYAGNRTRQCVDPEKPNVLKFTYQMEATDFLAKHYGENSSAVTITLGAANKVYKTYLLNTYKEKPHYQSV